jgi:DNA-binding beta-propeller fold protein YncE
VIGTIRFGGSCGGRLPILLIAMVIALLGATEARSAGLLSQQLGSSGCISSAEVSGPCQRGVALAKAAGVAISPDGKSLYVASDESNALAIFDRDPATGALTQKPGKAGCISRGGSHGACQAGRALNRAISVVVAPDGKNVYVASREPGALAIFDRDPATGALTQKPGKAGCIASNRRGPCQSFAPLKRADEVTISSDGRNVYVAATGTGPGQGALSAFDRDPISGTLRQPHGRVACLSLDGSGGLCRRDPTVGSPKDVLVSPDGRSAYVLNEFSDLIAVLARNRATGALTRRPSTIPCILERRGLCEQKFRFGVLGNLAISPDGRSLYLASPIFAAVAILDRNPATGALTQKPGGIGCISSVARHGVCREATLPPEPLGIAVSPDGANVYVASHTSAFIATFERDQTTGVLRQPEDPFSCISETGDGGKCQKGTALANVPGLSVSPDGKNLYAIASDSASVSILTRSGP